MRLLRFCAALALISMFVLIFAACERTVTVVEDTTVSQTSCFECHSDSWTFLVSAEAQYENSQHASGENIDRNGSPCSGCHTSEGWIWMIENGGSPSGSSPTITNPTAIHCFTCHAPHTDGNFNLRLSTPTPLQNGVVFDLAGGNACTFCHQSRRNVDTYVTMPNDSVRFSSIHWGPHHSVQSDMLIGSNGYEYSFFNYFQSPHKFVTRDSIADGCLLCHFDVPKNYILGGHSFNMHHEGEENTDACLPCHVDPMDPDDPLPDYNYKGIQDSVTALIDTLRTRLLAADLIDTSDHANASRGVPDGQGRTGWVASSDSAGAVWNFLMAIEDQSHGVHNAKYIIGLLQSAIDFLTPVPVAENDEVLAKGRKEKDVRP